MISYFPYETRKHKIYPFEIVAGLEEARPVYGIAPFKPLDRHESTASPQYKVE
jgi:hypothetical protein